MRRSTILLSAALVLLLSQVAWAFSYYPPAPSGRVGLARPTISQQVILGPNEEIERAEMLIDGVKAVPSWNKAGQVYYQPPEPLAPGVHRVRLTVRVVTGKTGYFYQPLVSEFSFEVVAGALSRLPGPGPEELRALAHLNRIRLQAGLGTVGYADGLGASAGGHARYLLANRAQREADPHRQVPGTAGFFGATGGDRADYYNYIGAPTSEVINFVDRAEDALDGWMDSLYHRIPLVHPGARTAGYGLAASGSDRVNVLQVGLAEVPDTVVWPYPGQLDVPTSWSGLETPDPFRLYPGVTGPVGYTVTLTFGGRVRSLSLTDGTLTGPSGQQVPVLRFDPAMDEHLSNTVALIPRGPLEPGAEYSVRLAGRLDLGEGPAPFEQTWRFRTAEHHPPQVLNREVRYTSGGTLVGVTVEGVGFAEATRVFLDGLPVRGLEILAPEQAAFQAPTGYEGRRADLLVVSPDGREAVWSDFFTGTEPLLFLTPEPPFAELPLKLGGKPYGLPALRHRSGALLLPAAALETLGGRRTEVEAIRRSYWTVGDLSGDYTLGRTVANAGHEQISLALPARDVNGTHYVDAAFVASLAGAEVWEGDEGIDLVAVVQGMTDVGFHWARSQIEVLLKAGIVSGVGDGTFRPDETLTRAAFVKMLTGARLVEPRPGETGGFADVAAHWVVQQGYLGAAVTAGILVPAEYPGGNFRPDQSITREEIAVMVARALGRENEAAARTLTLVGTAATVDGKRFADALQWTRPGHVAETIEQGIVTGYLESSGDYTFRPLRQATRAEAAVMTVRALGK